MAPEPFNWKLSKSTQAAFVRTVLAQLKAGVPEIRILLTLKQRNRPIQRTGADRGQLEDAGASEKLVQAMEQHPELTMHVIAVSLIASTLIAQDVQVTPFMSNDLADLSLAASASGHVRM
jgi:hypothetical protein